MFTTGLEEAYAKVLSQYMTCLQEGRSSDARRLRDENPEWSSELDAISLSWRMMDDWESEDYGAVPPSIRGFDLLDEVGSGGQGQVYKARQCSTNRIVALKVIRDGALATRAEQRRFQSEVELASRLKHPNIVATYESGRYAGRY